jgi:hypothetical protein
MNAFEESDVQEDVESVRTKLFLHNSQGTDPHVKMAVVMFIGEDACQIISVIPPQATRPTGMNRYPGKVIESLFEPFGISCVSSSPMWSLQSCIRTSISFY